MNLQLGWLRLLPLLPALALSANLQVQDLFFIGTHRNPTDVVGDDRNAFVLTEGGILVYDYRRRVFTDNLLPGQPIAGIRYSTRKSRLFISLPDGGMFEYNPVFRRATSVNAQEAEGGGEGKVADLKGMSFSGDYYFMGDHVRDKWNKRYPIAGGKVFDYDNLWVMTQGLGAFFGSSRRKDASSLWFGLYDPAAQALFADGDKIWVGGLRADGGFTVARTDLSDWRFGAAQQEYDFPNGSIHAITAWKGFIWMATERGVVRMLPDKAQYKLYRRLQNSTDLRVYSLHVLEDKLFAGNEQGVSVLENPNGEFRALEIPGNIALPVWDLSSKDKDLWAATKWGLYVRRKDEWKSLKEVSGTDVPESYGQEVLSVGYHDSSLYWATNNKIMIKPKKQQPRVLMERDGAFRIRFQDNLAIVGWQGGVTLWNLDRGLWTDLKLADGIPGTRVLSFALSKDVLWIGTDAGLMRVNWRNYLP